MITIEHVKTNEKYVADKVIFNYKDVTVTLSRETGNWHPEGKNWCASIRADITNYEDGDGWAYGLSAHGENREQALFLAYEFAQSRTLIFPSGWLVEVLSAVGKL